MEAIVKISEEFITETGLKRWVGLELPYDPNTQDPIDVFNKAHKTILDWHYNRNRLQTSSDLGWPNNLSPQPSIDPNYSIPLSIINKTEQDRWIGITADDIMSCQDLTVLDSYRLLVKGKIELEAAYNLRREQIIAIEKQDILDRTNALCKPPKQ